MGKKKIAIIGIGGRTGNMFAYQLKDSGDILGIGQKTDIDLIKNNRIYIKRNEKEELFAERVIESSQFPNEFQVDFLFLTTKNPVGPVVKFYYQKIKEKGIRPPTLFLSQNGVSAGEEAISALREIFGEEAEKIQVVRIVLFNPIDKKSNDNTRIIYSLPIRIAISKIFGPSDTKWLINEFKMAGFEITEVPTAEAKNMEFSKLFLNLIGMAAASRGFTVDEGFQNPEIFNEEIEALKEYIKAVRANGNNFLNFPHYPVKILSSIIYFLPVQLLRPLRSALGKLITKGRGGKLKDLDEIDYYNGVAIGLGERLGIPTPINLKIIERIKEK